MGVIVGLMKDIVRSWCTLMFILSLEIKYK